MTTSNPFLDKLSSFLTTVQPESRRVFHGRGHCYPGFEHICVDWFSPVMLISIWQPIDDAEQISAHIRSADIHNQVQAIVLQHRYENQSPAECLFGATPDKVTVRAQGMQFEVRPGRRQNAGLFLDMGPLREWLLLHAKDLNVLNLFAYTCALSVAALQGGAASVTNVDMSKPSIAWGMRNHLLNQQDTDRIHNVPHNVFKSWGRIQQLGRYDLVIIDPPTRQRGSFDASRDYKSVVKRLPKLCTPGATVVAALNSPFLGEDFLMNCFQETLPESELARRIKPASEFEERDPHKGLKIAIFRLPSQT